MTSRFAVGLGAGEDGPDAASAALERTLADEPATASDAAFAFVFASPRYDPEAVGRAVRAATDAPLLGCTSAGEFTHRGTASGSVGVALGLGDATRLHTGLGQGVSTDEEAAVGEAAATLPDRAVGESAYPFRSVVNLHDGLAGKGEEVTLATRVTLGPDVPIAGGSAGDDLEMAATHVLRDDEVATDAVGLGLVESRTPPAVTVAHGHEPVSPPLEVTRSDGAVVHELDGEPAFEVWKRHVRDRTAAEGVDVDALDAGDEALSMALTRYAFGLQTGQGLKIRWPGLTTTTDGPLQFTCSVPEGAMLRVTAGSRESQIESARRAAAAARERLEGPAAGALVFDCICRSTTLGDEFGAAVETMAETLDVPLLGFETYGEVAMERDQLSGYHNTTTVICLFPA